MVQIVYGVIDIAKNTNSSSCLQGILKDALSKDIICNLIEKEDLDIYSVIDMAKDILYTNWSPDILKDILDDILYDMIDNQELSIDEAIEIAEDEDSPGWLLSKIEDSYVNYEGCLVYCSDYAEELKLLKALINNINHEYDYGDRIQRFESDLRLLQNGEIIDMFYLGRLCHSFEELLVSLEQDDNSLQKDDTADSVTMWHSSNSE